MSEILLEPCSPSALPRARAWLLVAVLAPILCALANRDLWPPDEPRYGQVARECVADGFPAALHLNGEPYAEKPPLFFWLGAALSAPAGHVTAWGMRLASALPAALAAWLLARLARRWTGSEVVAVSAALIFSSMGLVLWHASRAVLDLPLTCAVLLAVERGIAWADVGGASRAIACGAGWAAAILFKGPMGVFLPPLAIAGHVIGTGRRPGFARGAWLAPTVAVALVLAWLVPAAMTGGETYRARLFGQLVSRATGSEGHNVRPFWFYVALLPLAVMPWTPIAIAGVVRVLRVARDSCAPGPARAGALAVLATAGTGLLILSALATKRDLYAIPLLPFLALAAASALDGVAPRGHFARMTRVTVIGVLVAGVVGALMLPAVGMHAFTDSWGPGPADLGAWPAAATLAAVLAAGLLAVLRVRRDVPTLVRRGAVALLTATVVFHIGYLPRIDSRKSYAEVAHAARAAAGTGRIYDVEGYIGNLLWSADQATIERVPTAADVARVLGPDAPPAAVVARVSWWREQTEAAAANRTLPSPLAGVRVAWTGWADRNFLVVLTRSPEVR